MSTNYDYTGSDYTVKLIGKSGKTMTLLPEAYESMSYGPDADSNTAQGSGKNPRAHATEVNKPKMSIKGLSHDTADRVMKFASQNGGILDSQISRQRPETGAKTITDSMHSWKPLEKTAEVKGGDVTAKDIEGNALKFNRDIKNALTV